MIKRKNGVNPLKYIIIVVIIVGIAVFFSEHYEETNDNYNAEEVTQINKELSSVFSEDYNNQTIEEKKEICKNKLDELEKNNYIKDIIYNEEFKIYEFKYTNGGNGGILVEPFKDNVDSISKNYATKDINGTVQNITNKVPLDFTVNPYTDNNLDAKFFYGLGYDDILQNIKEREQLYDSEWLFTSIDDDVTIDDFKTRLEGNDLIIIAEHGTFYKNEPVICTKEVVTTSNQKFYKDDILKDNISIVTYQEDNSGNSYYIIRPQFFKEHYKNKELKGTLIYLGCCLGYKNDKLVNAFKEAGADCVIGNTETVYSWYNARMQDAFVYALLCGDTAQEALNYAKSIWGQNDIEYAYKYFSGGPNKSEIATPEIYCGQNFKLVTIAGENNTPVNAQAQTEQTISYDQALKEGELCYLSAYQSYWGMVNGQDVIQDTANNMAYVNVTNMNEIKNRFSQKGFDQFCKYNEIQLINGTYYKPWGDRGSHLYYTGHELQLNLADITPNKITFTSIEKFSDPEWPTQKNRFVIVKENGQWVVDEFTLPD